MGNTKLGSCVKINVEVIDMNGTDRRKKIIEYIRTSKTPISGTQLAEILGVSRQVIVQDMALIRANGCDIISTYKGYIFQKKENASRVFHVVHTDEELEQELCLMVDMGGNVVNVMVDHEMYGHIEAELQINSRRKIREFVEDMKNGKSSPLKNITSNKHAHLVEAEDEKVLDMIEEQLKEKGFLV